MLTLYQFPGPWDVCSAGPFAAKLEGFLRWQNIPYKSITVMRMKGSPKGKIPFIEDENGVLGDSSLIMEYLTRKHNLTPDGHLTREEQGQARALRYLCEEGLYWAMVYFRWVDTQGWAIIKQTFFRDVPMLAQPVFFHLVQKHVRKMLRMQGMGRHSRDEIAHIACGDLQALSDCLGNKPYFFGNMPSTTDFVVFSIFANFTSGPFVNPVTLYARNLSNLMAHADRIRMEYFPQDALKRAA